MQHLRKFNEEHDGSEVKTKLDSKISELKSEFIFNDEWIRLENPVDTYPGAIFCYEKVIKPGYKSVLLVRKSQFVTATLYLLDEKEDQLLWLEDVLNPYQNPTLFRSYEYNKYINFINRITDKQMIYFDVRDKVMSKEDLEIMILTELTDNGFSLIDINFTYINSNWKDVDDTPEISFRPDIRKNNRIGYLSEFKIISSNFNKNILVDLIYQMEGKLEYFGDFYKIDYKIDINNLYLFIEVNKNKIN